MRVAVLGMTDTEFLTEARTRTGARVLSRAGDDCDLIFLGAAHRRELRRIAQLVVRLRRDGALWVVRPRANPDLTEAETRRAGLDAGLVDVKVVRFSETHTAEKFVLRLRDR